MNILTKRKFREEDMKRTRKMIALALAAALILVTFVGCGSKEASNAPKPTDTLIYAQGSEPRGLDPETPSLPR